MINIKKRSNLGNEVPVILSICIPTYNRAQYLAVLLDTLPLDSSDIEVIIIDDGSSDNTRAIVEGCRAKAKADIKYLYQSNAGRSSALRQAILLASAEFTVLMDSDDYFVEGWYPIFLSNLFNLRECIKRGHQRPVAGMVFGVRLLKGETFEDNKPFFSGVTNFVKLRADQGVKGDLKEVVMTSVLKECLYEVPEDCRRVPTSLLWTRIAEHYDCLTTMDILAVKEYLPGGMTDKILILKSQNAQPLVLLYLLLSESDAYRSRRHRWRSRILWARYSWHQNSFEFTHLWQYLVLGLGFISYCLDRLKLKCMK